MKINILNARILIAKNEVMVDAIGNHKNNFVPYHECYATISTQTGRETDAAGNVVDDSMADFTVRYCDKTKAITNTGYRLWHMGELWNIVGVDHMNYRNKSIKLKCQRARR